jgi:hypothetical protein
MTKNSLLLLLTTLLFTACVERGQTLNPTINTSMATPIIHKSQIKTPSTKSINTKKIVKEIKKPIVTKSIKTTPKKNILPTPSTEVKQTAIDNNDFFTLSDETKNKISGFFVIVIGILILI